MPAAKSRPAKTDRRDNPRNSRQNKATGIVQALIRDPTRAAAMLEHDLDAGGDPNVVFGLLGAVESIVQLRGIDLSAQVRALRKRIERKLGP